MCKLKADIVARVSLYPTSRGGRASTISPVRFGCPLFIDGEGFDCRLLLDQAGISLVPGATADVPIKFLSLDLVKPKLKAGVRFRLWEAGDFAEGEVLQVLV